MVRQRYKCLKRLCFKKISLKHNNGLMNRICSPNVSLKKQLSTGDSKNLTWIN
jgi:hypothetical protein